MSKRLDNQIVLRLEGGDRRALERLAEEQHRTLANYIRCALKDHLEASADLKQPDAMVA